ncbi:MAG: zinc dependent phospholipase C family protein, partial [Gallionellaceae bacterium]|nr:zinc dependent phospholipase C family protein [Gallionellaceae bacterium]
MINRCPCLHVVLATCLLVFPTLSHAFKIDTHLWIGQQVINDLDDDGMITVKLKDKSVTLPVPVDVKNAILSNRNEYLIGNIGPDALPDVVVGQTLVHPGNSTGWKTNDWLTFLLAKSQGNPLGTALAYGYLGHASADVFAHTYVNQYAGDIFELADETLVEQRHVALESFISRFNPSFVNATGQNLGAPYTLVQPGDGVANFVRDVLIYDDQAATQNANGSYSKHLAAYRNYRNKIRTAADSSLWQKIDEAVLQAVAAYYGYAISESEANALIDFLNNEVIPQVQQHIDLNQTQVNKLNAAMDRFDAAHFGALNDALRQVMDLHSTIATKLAQRLEAEGQLCTTVKERSCDSCCMASAFGHCVLWNWECRAICETLKLVCPISEAAGAAAADLITAIDAELNNTGGL